MKAAIGALAVLGLITLALSIAALGRWSDLDARLTDLGRTTRRQARTFDDIQDSLETLARLPAATPSPGPPPAPAVEPPPAPSPTPSIDDPEGSPAERRRLIGEIKGRITMIHQAHLGMILGDAVDSLDHFLDLTAEQEEAIGHIIDAWRIQRSSCPWEEEREAAKAIVMAQIRAQLDPGQQEIFDRKYALLELIL